MYIISADNHLYATLYVFKQFLNFSFQGEEARLLLTACNHDEFTCEESGECIPEELRCNLTPDCNDNSDEKKCLKLLRPAGYSTALSPPNSNIKFKIPIYIQILLTTIKEFDIVLNNIVVDYVQILEWRDYRLLYRNLRNSSNWNILVASEKVWIPYINVEDGNYQPTEAKTFFKTTQILKKGYHLPSDVTRTSQSK